MTVFIVFINNHNTLLFTWHDFSSEIRTIILHATHDQITRDFNCHAKYRMQYYQCYENCHYATIQVSIRSL